MLAADAESRGCYVTRKHARTLARMRPRRRTLQLKPVLSDSDDNDTAAEADLDPDEEDDLIREMLKVHLKRKKLRIKALHADNLEVGNNHSL